jgi:hypothetical protein
MNKLLTTLVCLCFAIGTFTAQTYSGGSGTEAAPFLISSKADMEALATATNGNSSYSTGKYFLLKQNITDAVTTIIGNSESVRFRGTFDGGGHTIAVNISTTENYAGVFGYISNNATIKNLGVTGSVSSAFYSGGICGQASSSTITNCYNTGSVSSSSYSSYLGGVCGYASSSTITNCYNTGSVSSSAANSYSGGICGYMVGTTKVSNCIATNATVTAGKNANAGRVVGYVNSGAIENCLALTAMLVNGATRSGQDANSKDGKDYVGLTIDACSHTSIYIPAANNIIQWQRSSDLARTWIDIACTSSIYTETDPDADYFIYRAQYGDGSYSPYVVVHYYNAVPSAINALPLTGTTKTVDEIVTFSLEPIHYDYSYQWYKNDTVITGANSDYYTIYHVKSADAGVYKCRVWNGCNETVSGTTTLTVDKSPQVITFPEIPVKVYGDAAIALPEKTDKGLTIAYQSASEDVATISGNTVTIKNVGSANIIATQAGDDNYLAATTVGRTLMVDKANQAISFAAFEPKIFGDPNIVLNQYSDAGLEITYASDNDDVATISGNTVVLHTVGTAHITATQAGNRNYNAATTITHTLTIGKASQTIVWNNIEPKTYGDADFYLPQSTNKGLTITYVSENENIAQVIDNKVEIKNAGATTITATQTGNSNYNAAAEVTLPLTVSKALRTITFGPLAKKTYGDPAFALEASVNSGLPIVYASSNPAVASISENIVTILNAGETNITAFVAGNDNYYATSTTETFTVQPVSLTIAAENKTRSYGDENPPLTYTIAGFVNDDAGLQTLPTIICGATPTSTVGDYDILVGNAADANYSFIYQNAKLTVNKVDLTIQVQDERRKKGEPNPAFTLLYDGFKNNETESVLDQLPTISCAADENAPVGFYDIILSGGNDNNYDYQLVNGELEIIDATGINNPAGQHVSLYPNPVKHDLFIKSDALIERVEIYNSSGLRILVNDTFTWKIDVSHYAKGIYFVKVTVADGVVTQKIVVQ